MEIWIFVGLFVGLTVYKVSKLENICEENLKISKRILGFLDGESSKYALKEDVKKLESRVEKLEN